MSEGYMKKNIDGLIVFWKVIDYGVGFKVRLEYKDTSFFEDEITKNSKPVPFSLLRSGGINYEIKGSLRWLEEKVPVLELDLFYPNRKTIRLSPDDDPIPNTQTTHEYLDLFPYLYICPWFRTYEEDLKDRFVIYDQMTEVKDGEGGSLSFYEALSSLKTKEERVSMESESVKFIDGSDPYMGQFLSGFEELKSILKYYEPLGRWLRRQGKVDFRILSAEVEKSVGKWEKIIACIETSDYMAEKRRLWDTFFALNITLGCDFKILEKIIITLVTASVLERIVARRPPDLSENAKDPDICENVEGEENDRESGKAIGEIVNEASEEIRSIEKTLYPPSPEEICRWAHVSILLPDTIFPLPPYKDETSSESHEYVKPFVSPYAVGELQMVQYRLRGYQLGEVSHIENILRGECKEVTERRFMQLNESELLGRHLQDERSDELESSTSDFLNEVNRTLKPRTSTTNFTDYNTTYAAGAVNINGSWKVVEDPAGGHFEDKAGFAKDVVLSTVRRVSRKVNWMRINSSLSESEEKIMHRFDNTSGDSNILGIYSWLNKVYSLRTVNRGNRLVLELQVEEPAASFLKSECQYHEFKLEKPVSPAELGLKDYRDVSESEGEGKCYYLDFFAIYEVPELLPPPPQSKTVTAVLESAKPFCTLNCEIPDGYDAETAKVSMSFKDQDSKAKVMVGNAVEECSAADNPLLNLNLEQTAIPISIMCLNSKATEYPSGKGSNDSNQVNYYLANVEIECKRKDHLIREWQLLAFRKIKQGYGKQKAEYYQQIEQQRDKILPSNLHLSRVVERQQLKRSAFSLLWNIYLERVGKKKDEEKQTVYMMSEPKYFQFFGNTLEWEEMTYYIQPAWDGAEKNDVFSHTGAENILRGKYFEQSDFLNFLKAKSARILLPVKPEFTFKFLYFLSSGLIWPGADYFVPITSLHKSLVNGIKALRECKAKNEAQENTWEVTLPTPMVVLQENSNLLELDE